MRPGYYKPRPLPRKPSYLGTRVPREPPKTKPHKGKKKFPNILIIGVVALVVFIAIILLLIKIFSEDKPVERNKYLDPLDELEMEISNAFLEGNLLKVMVNVGSNDESLKSIRFLVEGDGKEEEFLETYVSSPLYDIEYSLRLRIISPDDVEKVSIIPVLESLEGLIQSGSVEDTYFIYREPNNNDSDDGLPYDPYGSSEDNCTSNYDQMCHNGDVYWINSCYEFEEIKESCSLTEVCSLGVCVYDDSGSGSVCGNNIIETGEYCDGIDLGGEICASFGYNLGFLKCNNECLFDLSSCSKDDEGDSECILTSAYYCYQGDVWWYDSCESPKQIKENCASEEDCVLDTCEDSDSNLPPPPPAPLAP